MQFSRNSFFFTTLPSALLLSFSPLGGGAPLVCVFCQQPANAGPRVLTPRNNLMIPTNHLVCCAYACTYIHIYIHLYISRNIGGQSLRAPTGAISWDRREFLLILAAVSK